MPGKILLPLSPLFSGTTTHDMDLDRLGHNPFRRRNANRNESVSNRDSRRIADRTREQTRSSPLPQREWSAPPSPYRLPNRTSIEQEDDSHHRRPTSAWEPYVSRDEINAQSPQPSSISRQSSRKRRARNLLFGRDVSAEEQLDPTDFTLFYPQLSPYDDRVGGDSAAEASVHESDRLGAYLVSPLNADDFSPVSPIRSPTYPPATRSRSHNSVLDDAALADAEEFHLFVQATAGLGLDDGVGRILSEQSPISRREPGLFAPQVSIHETAFGNPISPVEESSMTLRAMQHLAQIPDGSNVSFAPSDLNPPPIRVSSAPPVQLTLEDFEGYNDDLPDYEESQNQHWSSRRVEAARRAQELAMRWRLTGARRGVM